MIYSVSFHFNKMDTVNGVEYFSASKEELLIPTLCSFSLAFSLLRRMTDVYRLEYHKDVPYNVLYKKNRKATNVLCSIIILFYRSNGASLVHIVHVYHWGLCMNTLHSTHCFVIKKNGTAK